MDKGEKVMEIKYIHSFPVMCCEIKVHLFEDQKEPVVRVFDKETFNISGKKEFFFCVDRETVEKMRDGETYVVAFFPDVEINYAAHVGFIGSKPKKIEEGFEVQTIFSQGGLWEEVIQMIYRPKVTIM